jgi:predicted metal-dependent peptidase
VFPSLYRPVPEVAVVCDTSGSMDAELLARVLAEVDAIVARAGLRSTGLTALAVDTTVHSARRVRRADQVSLAGGGGTDMGAGIAAALARRPRPEVIIVLTDGYTPWPDVAPPCRVVVGVLVSSMGTPQSAPAWARTVLIPS